MRATAQDPDAARLMGINVDRTIGLTFLLGGLLAGAAGLIYALYNGTVQFNQGFTAGLIAFTAAVMGGIGNLKGAVVGGLIIGVIQPIVGHRTTARSGRRRSCSGSWSWSWSSARRACSARRRAKDERAPPRHGARRTAARCAACCRTWAWVVIADRARRVALPVHHRAPDLRPSDDLLDASITTLAYIIMALGLNIVVGFAGLLDLGYVAFFAIGAFVDRLAQVAAVRRRQRRQRIHFLVAGHRRSAACPGHPHQLLPRHLHRGGVHGAVGRDPRRADAAPARRLPGDRDARVRRDRPARVRELDERHFGIGSIDFSNGRQGITPIDKRQLPDRRASSTYPLELKPHLLRRRWRWCSSVLFVNVRLRDSRLGRAWIAVREDEVAAAAMGVHLVRTKLWAYAIGASHRRLRGRLPRRLPEHGQRRPVRVRLLGLHPLHDHPRRHGQHRRRDPRRGRLSMINRFLLPELNTVPDKFGLDFDVTAISFGIFGFLLLVMMVLRPEGLIPNRQTQARAARGRRRGRRAR